eukprot:Hpha_TRINITY_DN15331_c6_g16::TRINITY_DN15331_c6_g16_i1::g.89348::m.89348
MAAAPSLLPEWLGLDGSAAACTGSVTGLRSSFEAKDFTECLRCCGDVYSKARDVTERHLVVSIALQSLHETGQKELACQLLPSVFKGRVPGGLAVMQVNLLADCSDISAVTAFVSKQGGGIELLEASVQSILGTPGGHEHAPELISTFADKCFGPDVSSRLDNLRRRVAAAVAAASRVQERREKAEAEEKAAANSAPPPSVPSTSQGSAEKQLPAAAVPPAPEPAMPRQNPATEPTRGVTRRAESLTFQDLARSFFQRLLKGELTPREFGGLLAALALLVYLLRGRASGGGKVITL